MDKHSACKDEKPQRKRKHDDEDEDDDEIEEKRNVRDTGKVHVRADRDKNFLGIVHTIVGGPPASRYAACCPSASTQREEKARSYATSKLKE